MIEVEAIEYKISVCKAFETSQKYIDIQPLIFIFEFEVGFTKKGPTKSTETFRKVELGKPCIMVIFPLVTEKSFPF